MNKKIRELMARKAKAAEAKVESLKAASKVLDGAEGRALTAEEQSSFDAHKAAAASKASEIDRLEDQIAMETELAASAASAGVVIENDAQVIDNITQDPKLGFKNFGEYAASVFRAGMPNSRPDQRLLIGASAPSTFGGEGAGQDGGFIVPPQFSQDIFKLSLGGDALLPLTDSTPIESNSMVFPKDETTPWGTDGVRAYWQGEAAAGTATKPKFGTSALRLKKLLALVPVTDELLEDASALTAYLPGKVGDSIRWKTDEGILFGSGAALPAGALAGNAAITVAKDSGQATKTLTASNLANMIARLPPGSFPKAVWIINNDVLPALFTLTLGNYPIYLPAGSQQGGIQGSPYGTLLGRPVLVSQHANTFSSQGDVTLVDLSYYQTITKSGGIQTATSMHLYFDADAVAFRTTFRLDGQPKIAKPISPAKGTNSLSPFVQLGAR